MTVADVLAGRASWAIEQGDCLKVLATLPDASIDAVVTDPPYGIGFMGREWDTFAPDHVAKLTARKRRKTTEPPPGHGHHESGGYVEYDRSLSGNQRFQTWCEAWARECLRVLKPGGHLVSFGGCRTYHRLAAGVEDAAFEVRDCLSWIFGSGFPKSHNLDKNPIFCSCSPLQYSNGIRSQDVRGLRPGVVAADPLSGVQEPDLFAGMRAIGGGALPAHAAASERDVRGLRCDIPSPSEPPGADIDAGVLASMQWDDQGEGADRTVEQPQGSASSGNRTSDGEESRLEGRGDVLQDARPLHRSPVRSGAGLGEDDGASGRLRDGAPARHGPDDRAPIGSDRGRPPSGSSARLERADESRTLAGQQESQTSGVWPLCGRCGQPRIPSGLGSALKPAHEPIVLARKPLVGSIAANVLAHGVGALNVDGCRLSPSSGNVSFDRAAGDRPRDQWRTGGAVSGTRRETDTGRWPPNVLLGEEAAEELDRQSGVLVSGANPARRGSDKFRETYGEFRGQEACAPARGVDTGGASRFFPIFRYEPKADRTEREAGLDHLPPATFNRVNPGGLEHDPRWAPTQVRNHHPTVKPVALMIWLCRLVTPPGGVVLDPFAGSGTTGVAARRCDFRFIGIEREAEYVAIARARIDGDMGPMFRGVESEAAG